MHRFVRGVLSIRLCIFNGCPVGKRKALGTCITPSERMNLVQSFAAKQLLQLTSSFTGVVD